MFIKMSRSYYLFCCLLVVAMLLVACKPTPTPEHVRVIVPTQTPEPTVSSVPVITWILDGVGSPRYADDVMAYLNNLPQVKALNINVKLIWYDWSSYDQKTQQMFTSGEFCDLIFTSNWANNYVNGAISGNYLALDDLLPKYAPKTWSTVPKVVWTMSKVNDKIYAIPNQQGWYNAWGFRIRKDLAEKYNVNLDQINEYKDLTPLMEKILADYPYLKNQLVQGAGPFAPGTMGYDGIPGGFGAIKQGDATRKIINLNAEQVMRDRVTLWREWEQKGYAPQELMTDLTVDAKRKEGLFPVYLSIALPGFSALDKVANSYDWIGKPLEKPVLGNILHAMTGVCKTSKNPELALSFFDLMYSDEKVFNTVAKGLEGEHWVWVDKDKKLIGFPPGYDPNNTGYNVYTDWIFGNNFLAYYTSTDQVGAWDETAKVNNEAMLPMTGSFIFDPTPVQAELAALAKVDKQFGEPLQFGLVDPADPAQGIDAWIKAENDAGAEKVIDEEQKQLDTFVKANPDIFK